MSDAVINEKVTATGRVQITVTGPDGEVKQTVDINNLVVTVGKNFIASRMAANTAAVISHLGVGTSSTAAAAGDTQLAAELARVAITSGTASTNVVTYAATLSAGVGTGSLQEAGLFNASGIGTGTMLARVTFGLVTKGSGDTMTITWTVTIN